MAGEWKQTRLGDHITLKGGLSYKGEFVDKGDALLIGMGCVSHTERFLQKGGRQYGGDFNEAHLVRPGDLVIATRQQSDNLPILGFPAMIPEDLRGRNVIAATNLYKVTNHSEISNRFLYWLMRSPAYRERILGCAKGSTVRMLTKDAIEDFDFLCPPEEEREAIAEILDTLVDKIELNRRMNETLEAIARAIFNSWFVDFDPVRAKASGELPESICRRLRLTTDLLALFPDRLVDSQLGEIPEGWEWSSVGEEVLILGGGTPSTANPEFWNGEYAWVTPKDLSGVSAKVLIGSERKITQAGVKKISSGQLPIGTVLLSSRAPIGYLSLSMIPVSINQGFIAMVCDKRLPNTYVLQWTIENLDAIKQRGSGTTFAEISKTNFRPMVMLVPGEHVLKAFHEYAMPLYEQITAKVRESKTLGVVRDTLLPKLLSGELKSFSRTEMTEAV